MYGYYCAGNIGYTSHEMRVTYYVDFFIWKRLSDQRTQWLQTPSDVTKENLNNARRGTSKHCRNRAEISEKQNYLAECRY